jgi:hypothetical protein
MGEDQKLIHVKNNYGERIREHIQKRTLIPDALRPASPTR